jgi:hypothetical protein
MNTLVSLDTDTEYNFNNVSAIRDTIENMNKFNQVEILRILMKYKSVIINENKYGIHINLSELDHSILNEIVTYINYISAQEKALDAIEQQKEDYKNTYFLKDTKDIVPCKDINAVQQNTR